MFLHDDVIKWKHFPCYWPFVRGIHRSPVNSPHKGQWREAFMFSLIYAWINCWVNNLKAGDLRHYHAHYDVTVMLSGRYVQASNAILLHLISATNFVLAFQTAFTTLLLLSVCLFYICYWVEKHNAVIVSAKQPGQLYLLQRQQNLPFYRNIIVNCILSTNHQPWHNAGH